jgi:methylamine---corrinoid protein Co-methyltransferase
MLTNLEIYRRAASGQICTQKEFDLKRYIPAVRSLIKKHGINYDPTTPVPSDDDLVERVWQAGRELFLQVGVYCVDTERIITFDEVELDQALAHAPRPVILGTGQQARAIPVRRPESSITPFFSLGACGAGVTSDEVFMSLTQAYCELPYTDAVASPAMTEVDGMTIVAGSPLEVEGCVRTVTMTREAARRANRAGLGIANTVPTGVKSQGHIAGNAAAADQGDMMEIGNIAELKIDFDNLSKITYMQGRGRTILGETGPVIGGYAGGPEGCAITLTGYHFFALLVLRASVQHPYTSHYQTQSCTSRQAFWLTSLALQAITRHSDVPCLETGTLAAGPATEMSLLEAAAMSASSVVSGGNVESGPTSRGTHLDYLSPMANLFAAEVGRSVVGMCRKDVNAIVVQLLDKYESRLTDPPLGKRYQDCYDMPSRQPKAEALVAYRQARAALIEMGLQFKDPPFYS